MGSSAEIRYYHHDNLGSLRMMTDKIGQVVWEQDYLPFGEDLQKPGVVMPEFDEDNAVAEYKYTGQRQVRGIGLYYYGARYYGQEIGRFITEYMYSGEKMESQIQNKFVYVINNRVPIKEYVASQCSF